MSGNNRKLLAVCSAIAVTLLFLLTVFSPNSFVVHNLFGRFVLTGDTPSVVRRSELKNHADPSQKLRVLIGLKLRDEVGLNKLIADIYNPASPNYRKYLSPDDFAARFSPTSQDVDFVIAHMQSRGLTIVNVSPNRTLIEVEGTVTQLEKVFSVTINQYTIKLPGGVTRQYLSNDRDPALPARLSQIVESVMGLDTFAEFESRMRKDAPPPLPAPAASKPSGFSPQEIATVYEFPTANNANLKGTKYSGSGKNDCNRHGIRVRQEKYRRVLEALQDRPNGRADRCPCRRHQHYAQRRDYSRPADGELASSWCRHHDVHGCGLEVHDVH